MRARSFSLIALPLLLAACGPKPPEGPENANPARNVVVRLVQPQQLDVKIKLPVVIQPKDTIELRAAAAGTLVSLPYNENELVPASSLPERRAEEADGFANALKERIVALDETIKLRGAKGGYLNQEDLDKFSADLDAMVQFTVMDDLAQLKPFATIDRRMLDQQYVEAREALGKAVRDLKRTMEYKQSTGSQKDDAAMQVILAHAAVNRIIAMIEDTYVCNPDQGVLTERMRKQGEYVNPGELLGKIAVMNRLVAELEIPEAHRQALSIGETMKVEISSLKDEAGHSIVRDAKITRIDSVAHPTTHSFSVELEIPNEDLKLPAGIFGTTEVTIYSKPDALVVPLTALRLSGESKSLFVLPASGGNQVRELSNIELGQLTAQWVEIRGDKLKPGMRVVTFGAQMLGDGDEVNWSEKDPYVVAGDGEKQS
ncbi:MAG: efflux RND transporter periplasmic adaptor subunit [Planctomycetes bacterium]|nr:efflux RND transporter periplasmic adaptor subunit [Planctomycetota bacterium]